MTIPIADPLVRFTDDIVPRPIPEALLAARRDVMAAVRGPRHHHRCGPRHRVGLEGRQRGGDPRWLLPDLRGLRAGRHRCRGRGRARPALTEAERPDLIAPATAARWDLHGILLQLPDAAWDADPGGGEWTVRQTLGHVISGQRGYGGRRPPGGRRRRSRPMTTCPTQRPPFYEGRPDRRGRGDGHAGRGPSPARRAPGRIDRCGWPACPPIGSRYGTRWAGFAVDIGFRIGRWSSHFREHTIQVEKTHGDDRAYAHRGGPIDPPDPRRVGTSRGGRLWLGERGRGDRRARRRRPPRRADHRRRAPPARLLLPSRGS